LIQRDALRVLELPSRFAFFAERPQGFGRSRNCGASPAAPTSR
jgi:hypothetical protein